MNLEFDMIAPAHGVIWRSYISELLEAYKQFINFSSKIKW